MGHLTRSWVTQGRQLMTFWGLVTQRLARALTRTGTPTPASLDTASVTRSPTETWSPATTKMWVWLYCMLFFWESGELNRWTPLNFNFSACTNGSTTHALGSRLLQKASGIVPIALSIWQEERVGSKRFVVALWYKYCAMYVKWDKLHVTWDGQYLQHP